MRIVEYQEGAISTAIYPKNLKLIYPTLGLCGEIGELIDAFVPEFEKEVGDVLWYVANVANDAKMTLRYVLYAQYFSELMCQEYANPFRTLPVCAGVIAENVKKAFRDHDGVLTLERCDNIRNNLRQIVICLAYICNQNNTTLEKCAELNYQKLKSRQQRGKLQGDGNDR